MELITLQQYDSRWIEIFKLEQGLVFKTLGKYINKIHHIGSTAIPDLLSKPIIDIAIESGMFPPSQAIIDDLEAIGYECKGESGVKGRVWFIKGQPREFNLHFYFVDSDIVRNQIIFRDKLIIHAPFRREYEALKRKNYYKQDIDSPSYAHAKSSFIHKVLTSKVTS